MSIGMYDLDITNYHYLPFNLEIMKLSSYYKGKRKLVGMMKDFYPEMYSKVIVRKDINDGEFPKKIFKDERIEVGGYSLTNGVYSPLPLEIEKQIPDTSIYSNLKSSMIGREEAEHFSRMTRSPHLRLSLDGKTIWKDFECQFELLRRNWNIVVHDKGLEKIEGAREALLEIIKRPGNNKAGVRVISKFPVAVYNEKDLRKWLEVPFHPSYEKPILYGVLDDEVFADLCKTGLIENFSYCVAGSGLYEENHFTKNLVQKIYKQLIFAEMTEVKVHLTYEKGFFIDRRWERLFNLFSFFFSGLKWEGTQDEYNCHTLYTFCKDYLLKSKRTDIRTMFRREELLELFSFASKENYELFKLFYECRIVRLEGGELKNDWSPNQRKI